MESIATPHYLFNRSVFAVKPACGTSFGCFGLDCSALICEESLSGVAPLLIISNGFVL